VSWVEEYQKGSDYAPILEKVFADGRPCVATHKWKTFPAAASHSAEIYTLDLGRSWLRATKEWLLNNGYHLSEETK
jgi:hypothetical protein